MSKLNIDKIDKNMGFMPEIETEERSEYENYSKEELGILINKLTDKLAKLTINGPDAMEIIHMRIRIQQRLVDLTKIYNSK